MADWREAVDPASGRTYYANVRTKVTTWHMPEELRRLREKEEEPDSPPPPPPPPQPRKKTDASAAWEKGKDASSGAEYFYNKKTGQMAWEQPDAEGKVRTASVSDQASKELAKKKDSELAKKVRLLELNISKLREDNTKLKEEVAAGEKAKAEADELRARAERAEKDLKEMQTDIVNERKNMHATQMSVKRLTKQLEEVRVKARKDAGRAADLEKQLAAVRKQAADDQRRLTEEVRKAKGGKAAAEPPVSPPAVPKAGAAAKGKAAAAAGGGGGGGIGAAKKKLAESKSSDSVSSVKSSGSASSSASGGGGKRGRAPSAAFAAIQSRLKQSFGDVPVEKPKPKPKPAGSSAFADMRAKLASQMGGGDAAPPTPGGGAPPTPGGGGAVPPAPGGAAPPTPGGAAPPAPGGAAPPAPGGGGGGGGAPPAPSASATRPVKRAMTMTDSRAPSIPAPALPAGWEEHTDPSTGKSFFSNTKTKETTWTRPTGGGLASVADEAPPAPPSASSSGSSSAWTETVDPSTGQTYYYNKVTHVTSWDPPPGYVSPPAPPSEAPPAESRAGRSATSFGGPGLSAPGGRGGGGGGAGADGGGRGHRLSISLHPKLGDHFRPARDEEKGVILVHTSETSSPARLSHEHMAKYSMERYAEQFFKQHKKGLMSKQTLADMLKHTRKPITSSLQRLSSKMEADAVQFFKNIISYTGERKSSKAPLGHVQKLTRMGVTAEESLRDEIFCQLVKQTTENANRETLKNGWKLLCVLIGIFPPSKRFAQYLMTHLQLHIDAAAEDKSVSMYAQFAMERLTRSLINGPREHPPSKLEVEAVERLKNIVIPIYLPDGSKKRVAIQSQTTVLEMVNAVSEALGLPFRPWPQEQVWALYQMVDGDDSKSKSSSSSPVHPEIFVPYMDRVLDVRERWFERQIHDNPKCHTLKDIKLLFKPRLFISSVMQNLDADALHMFFIQAVADITKQNYPCDERDGIHLAALQIRAYSGRKNVDLGELLKDTQLPLFFPKSVINKHKLNPGQLRRLVKAEFEKMSGFDAPQAKAAYLAKVSDMACYGATFYPAEVVSGREPEPCVLGVSERGVYIQHPVTRQLTKKAIPLTQITQHDYRSGTFTITVTGGKTSAFKTKFAKEATRLVSVYSQEAAGTPAGPLRPNVE